MTSSTLKSLRIGQDDVAYRLVRSKAARQIRLRVGVGGLEVVQPTDRTLGEVEAFLHHQKAWVLGQLRRVERFRRLRRAADTQHLWLRGERVTIRYASGASVRHNSIALNGNELILTPGASSTTPMAVSLERWLRRRAKDEVQAHVHTVAKRLHRSPGRVYIMGQRTKWGNCSTRRNLSFNWRLIMAPPFVLEYIVAHEVVHLLVPDHSQKFWLTLRSIDPSTNLARRWLQVHGDTLRFDLSEVCREPHTRTRSRSNL